MQDLTITWYNWAVFFGLLISAGIAVYIWLDSAQQGTGDRALLPRVLSVVAVLLVLPSLFFRMTQGPEIIAKALTSNARGLPDTNFPLWAYAGMVGLVFAIAALLLYMSKRSVPVVSEMPLPTFAPPPTMPMPPAPVAPTVEPAPRAPDPTKLVSPEPETKAWLVVRNGKMSGRQFGLGTRSANIIGRDPNKADIVIDESTVSREHARLKFDNGQFVIFDMASTGGTYVNGNSVQRQLLYDNDRIRLGNIEFVYKKV